MVGMGRSESLRRYKPTIRDIASPKRVYQLAQLCRLFDVLVRLRQPLVHHPAHRGFNAVGTYKQVALHRRAVFEVQNDGPRRCVVVRLETFAEVSMIPRREVGQ